MFSVVLVSLLHPNFRVSVKGLEFGMLAVGRKALLTRYFKQTECVRKYWVGGPSKHHHNFQYPPLEFKGNIHYVTTKEKTDEWCKHIVDSRVPMVALDVQRRPDPPKGTRSKVSLVGMCFETNQEGNSRMDVVLFHVKATGMVKRLADILESDKVLKIIIRRDVFKLKHIFKLEVASCVNVVQQYKNIFFRDSFRRRRSLRKVLITPQRMVKDTLHRKLNWNEDFENHNWEEYPLAQGHLQYVANKVYGAYESYFELKRQGKDTPLVWVVK